MATPPFQGKRRNTLLAVTAAGAFLAFSFAKPLAIDLALHANSGRALVRLGFASIELVFDSGRECPNSNACGRPLL